MLRTCLLLSSVRCEKQSNLQFFSQSALNGPHRSTAFCTTSPAARCGQNCRPCPHWRLSWSQSSSVNRGLQRSSDSSQPTALPQLLVAKYATRLFMYVALEAFARSRPADVTRPNFKRRIYPTESHAVLGQATLWIVP